MALNSPGVEVTIIDQSQYLPAAPNSVPLLLVATAQNKATPSGTSIAPGTTAANAGKLYAVTSQRDLVNLFGTPFFYKTTNGTPIQGYELNEYGLQTAYSILGSTNLVYVLRADIDLAALIGQTGRPSGEPATGTYWLDTTNSSWGIKEFSASTGLFTTKIPMVIVDPADLGTGTGEAAKGTPAQYLGNIGDYAVSEVYNYSSNTVRNDNLAPNTYSSYWYKAGAYLQTTDVSLYNQWVAVGSPQWYQSVPATVGALFNDGQGALTAGGQLTFTVTYLQNGNLITEGNQTVTLTSGDSITTVAGNINTAKIPFVSCNNVNGRLQLFYTADVVSVSILGTNAGSQQSGLIPAGTLPITVTSYPIGISYGTNAQMPLWKTTDSTPRATGSVWIQTNTTSGLAPSMKVYSASTGSWSTVPVGVSTSDWVYTNAIDSTGGKAIPAGSVYAQVNGNDTPSTPIQMWRRIASGPAVYTGSSLISSISFPAGTYYYTVNVSVPGQSTLSDPYVITFTLASPLTGQEAADYFVRSFQAAMIPNTEASSAGTYVTLTHTAGGVIVLDPQPTTAQVLANTIPRNPLITTGGVGFTTDTAPYAPNVNGSNAAKYGPYSRLTSTPKNISPVAATGTGGTMTVVTEGNEPIDFILPVGGTGSGYSVNDYISVTNLGATFLLEVVTVSAGAITGVKWDGYLTDAPPTPPTAYYTTLLSNWQAFSYIPNEIAVTVYPANNTYWYYSTASQVDIMTNLAAVNATFTGSITTTTLSVTNVSFGSIVVGMNLTWAGGGTATIISGAGSTWTLSSAPSVNAPANTTFTGVAGPSWVGYLNTNYGNNGLPVTNGGNGTYGGGPILSADAPTVQPDGTVLQFGDLWVDTNDLENYPVISRWESTTNVPTGEWVLIDNADQTTQNGIVFADARWGSNGTIDPVDDPIPTTQSLLTSNYLDLDAPDPSLYPQGTLLWNTRRSGYNVKQFKVNYFNARSFPDMVLPQETSTWVSASGLMPNGAPYMGRKAQRNLVVQSLKSTLDTNTEIREEDTFINLLATPNYPELQPNMVVLNNDRNQTSYIVGDTPLRLATNATDILAWSTNAAGATATGEQGLVTRDTYLGLYYPSAIASDLTGAQVVMPSSYMMMKTMLYNDTVAYPWFAPAGQRRGVVSNATNIGYLDAQSGEFVTDKNRVSLRDVEYGQFINPIAYFTNVGILNYGNKNSFDSQSALDRTNVARLICYLRYQLQKAVRPFLFEPNTPFTRNQVRSVVESLMLDIQAKSGIYDYLVVCDGSNNTPARIDRNELWCDVAIEPVKAVEFIYIPVRILNTGEIAGLAASA